MAVDSTRQICGNCGAPNDAGAVVCVVCGALLSAYAPQAEPESIAPAPETTTTTTTTTPRPTNGDRKPTPSTDWRGMFETRPGRLLGSADPLRDLERDFRDNLPQSKATANQSPEAKPDERTRPRPAPEIPTTTSPPPQRPQPTAQQPRVSKPKRARAQAVNTRPGVDPRFNRRRPQSIIGAGVFFLLMGCIVAVILSAAGAGDVPVALAFLCLSPLGFIAIVAGIVISISRKEGRGG